MAANVIRAKLDIIFKKLFSDNIDLLHDLLSSLLEIPKDSIRSVKLRNSEILPDDIAGKFIREEFDMLEQTGIPPIQKAVYVLHQMSEDEKLQESARLREKALHVEASALGHARREGIEIGEKRGEKRGIKIGEEKGRADGMKIGETKGRREGKLETAKSLLAMGLPAEQISKATGLDIEEIKK